MEKDSKNEIIAASSIWVAVLLNFIPGLGTGYIYQRRWKCYWITNIACSIWIIIGFYNQLSIDPNDPISQDSNTNFLGLLIISLITSIESYLCARKLRSTEK